ncbi:prenyl transferase [Thozetella sp. PMI_491]|nr:prenyl transferase [Thozetella sp. PMI_491]
MLVLTSLPFASGFAVSSIATFVSAFVLGYLLKHPSKLDTGLRRTIQQYGYAKRQKPLKKLIHDNAKAPDCPYEYLLNIYGRHHFAPFVKAFDGELKNRDPEKYTLILDIMDAVHFCLILVDDICDDSPKRKNQTTAHLIYGSSETANRAYFVLTKVINRAMREFPVLGTELLEALEQILEGQDISLVWRRDGLQAFAFGADERVLAYKNMAQLKTGTLFVLLGRLLNDGGNQLDDLFLRFGWYAQLQNDCKNVYSADYSTNKGAVAEDLRNGELSFPIVVGLNDEVVGPYIEKAFRSQHESEICEALAHLESAKIKKKCLNALQEAARGLDSLVGFWGRREQIV